LDFALVPVSGSDRTRIASNNLSTAELTATIGSGVVLSRLSGPPHSNGFTAPVTGDLRFCLLAPCATPLATLTLGLSGVGFGGTAMATNGLFVAQATHSPWTISTATLPSSTTSVTAAGFLHGPASNSVTAGLPGGVLQLVAPTLIASNVPALDDSAMFTKLTIMLPEPGQLSLLLAGAALLAGLGGRRRRDDRME
jgi:hypothetical protein